MAEFEIRDGILWIRSWEWDSTRPIDLGSHCIIKVRGLDLARESPAMLWADFDNGWRIWGKLCVDAVSLVWCRAFPKRIPLKHEHAYIAQWEEARREYGWLDADALLRLIADIASRPPHPQEG